MIYHYSEYIDTTIYYRFVYKMTTVKSAATLNGLNNPVTIFTDKTDIAGNMLITLFKFSGKVMLIIIG